MPQPTEEQLRKALDQAIADGNERAAREIANQIVGNMDPEAVKPYREAAAKQSAVYGSLADRERMSRPQERAGSIESFGTPEDFAKGAGRTTKFLLTLPTEVIDSPVKEEPQQGTLRGEFLRQPEEAFTKPAQAALKATSPEAVDEALNRAGVSLEGGENTFMGRSGEFVAGGLLGGIGNAIRAAQMSGFRGLGNSLARNITASEAALLGAEGGGNFAESMGLPRISGELTGAMAPSMLVRAFNRIVTGASQPQRAANSLTAKENVATADDLAIEISAGVASPNTRTKFFERLLASVPGGMRVMHEYATRVNQQVEQALARITTPMRGVGGREAAGIGISSGLNRRVKWIQDRARRLYRNAENIIAPDTPVSTNNFRQALDDLAEEAPDGIKSITSVIRSGRKPISPAVRDALNAIEDNGPLTFEQANALRRVIGAEINQSSVITNAAHGELKKMYGALADDISGSLSGTQKAAYDGANKFWRESRDEIDNFISPIFGKGGKKSKEFTKMFDRLFAGDGKNLQTVRTVWKSLNNQEREVAAKALIARMGRATDEVLQAGEAGRLNPNFRMKTFLNKWRSPDFAAAKDIIFEGNPKFRKDMDQFVSFTENFLSTNAALENPSQSGPVGLAAASAFLALAGLGAGGLELATRGDSSIGEDAVAGALTGIGGLALAAKGTQAAATLMTSPRFVEWLARGTKVPIRKTPEYIGQLAAIAQDDPYLADAIASFTSQLSAYTDPTLLDPSFRVPGKNVD